MQRFYDEIKDRAGNVIRSATVSVLDAAGNLATIYSDNGVTTQANPITTDDNGRCAFYAANGTYSLLIGAPGLTSWTRGGVLLNDPVDDGWTSGSMSARKRIYGAVSNGSGAYTMHLTMRAPAHYDAVRLVLTGGANVSGIKAAVAASTAVGNAVDPTGAAWVPVTWGTTDVGDFRNPGGSAATTAVSGASGAGVTLIEGAACSDWVNIQSLARTDNPSSPPLLMLRLYGNDVPAIQVAESSSLSGNPFTTAEPEHYSGYWAGDYTMAAAPGPAAQGWLPCVDVVFMLRGKRALSIGVAGDSIEQGWVNAAAVPQFGGNINGWGRRLVAKFNAAGIPASYTALCHAGNKSQLFHNRAYNALLTGGLSHLFIKPWSTNEHVDGLPSVVPAIVRTNQLIELCLQKRVKPIIITPWAGQSINNADGDAAVDYCLSLANAGVTVFDARAVIGQAADLTAIRTEYLTLNSSGAVVDYTHINDAGQEAVANYAFAYRSALGLF